METTSILILQAVGFLHTQTLCDSPLALEGVEATEDVTETLTDILDFLTGALSSYDVPKHLGIR